MKVDWDATYRSKDDRIVVAFLSGFHGKSTMDQFSDLDHFFITSGIVNPKKGWPFFRDFHAGRKCVQWYVGAGFTDLEVSSHVEEWWYPGSAGKQTFFFESCHMQHSHTRQLARRAIDRGFNDQETADKAVEEIQQWECNPQAFYFHPLVTISGRVSEDQCMATCNIDLICKIQYNVKVKAQGKLLYQCYTSTRSSLSRRKQDMRDQNCPFFRIITGEIPA